jgi:uncharacterized glyoxalase superfamily protein PhnB
MRSNRSAPAATVIPVLTYPDVRAAVAWLTSVFGFEERMRVGENHRSQMGIGDGDLIVADTGSRRTPPAPGQVVASVMVRVPDVRAHCAHARAAIVMEPTDFEYGVLGSMGGAGGLGERQYEAVDPAGHLWTFTDVDPALFSQ